MEILKDYDRSINWIEDADIGKHETRLVWRDNKAIIYLSSQTGCDHACRMCHLTQTGQLAHRNVTMKELMDNCDRAIIQMAREQMPSNLHLNFMARGEPLANTELLDKWEEFSTYAAGMKYHNAHNVDVLISTIFPKTFNIEDLQKLAKGPIWPKLYYSAYSAEEKFRKKWLPKAHSYFDGIEFLKEWTYMGGNCKIHFAFIEGENDSEKQVEVLCNYIAVNRLRADVNIVRYNPANDSSRESSESIINRNTKLIKQMLPYAKVKIIPRVGFNVKASCGMFVS
jgi:adenine C2-methylase RlmN of 23S rRNA A2503 and tRNA A37